MVDTKKSGELLITQKYLNETRDELKSDNASLRLEMKAGFGQIKSDIKNLDSKVEKVLSAVHRVTAIVEEQETRNKYVLDGYQSLRDLHESDQVKSNERITNIEQTISKINNPNS